MPWPRINKDGGDDGDDQGEDDDNDDADADEDEAGEEDDDDSEDDDDDDVPCFQCTCICAPLNLPNPTNPMRCRGYYSYVGGEKIQVHRGQWFLQGHTVNIRQSWFRGIGISGHSQLHCLNSVKLKRGKG